MKMSQADMDRIRFRLEEFREALAHRRLEESDVQSLLEEISMWRGTGASGSFDGALESIEMLLTAVHANLQATSWFRSLGK